MKNSSAGLPKEPKAIRNNNRGIVKTVYTVYVDSWFWACHCVTMPDGSAEPPHSHNFCAAAKLTCENLDDRAMVMDFCQLRKGLEKITADIAGSGNIGRIDYFAKKGQTAEIIAQYIFERLETTLPAGVGLKKVKVTEQTGSRAAYTK